MPRKIQCLQDGCLRARKLRPGPVCARGQCLEVEPYDEQREEEFLDPDGRKPGSGPGQVFPPWGSS